MKIEHKEETITTPHAFLFRTRVDSDNLKQWDYFLIPPASRAFESWLAIFPMFQIVGFRYSDVFTALNTIADSVRINALNRTT